MSATPPPYSIIYNVTTNNIIDNITAKNIIDNVTAKNVIDNVTAKNITMDLILIPQIKNFPQRISRSNFEDFSNINFRPLHQPGSHDVE